jgi:hypothetical protein
MDTESLWSLSERLPDAKDRALVREAADEIERLRAALKEIAELKGEDLPLADGLPEDNLAAHYARIALEQRAG